MIAFPIPTAADLEALAAALAAPPAYEPTAEDLAGLAAAIRHRDTLATADDFAGLAAMFAD